jgi:hypothetical protein
MINEIDWHSVYSARPYTTIGEGIRTPEKEAIAPLDKFLRNYFPFFIKNAFVEIKSRLINVSVG